MTASMHARQVVEDTDGREAFVITVSKESGEPTKVIVRNADTSETICVMTVDGMAAMVLSQALSLAGTMDADEQTADKGRG